MPWPGSEPLLERTLSVYRPADIQTCPTSIWPSLCGRPAPVQKCNKNHAKSVLCRVILPTNMLVAKLSTHLTSNSDAREQVLYAAERLFAAKGYAGTTLRDIATVVGIRHASLYHHAPGGKEELFVEVMGRALQRHRDGLVRCLASAPACLRGQLYAVADWLLAHAPIDLVRMVHADMPAIDAVQADRLSSLALESLILPIEGALHAAAARGEVADCDLGVVAGGLIGMIESLHAIPDSTLARTRRTRAEFAHRLIDVLLDGLYTHREEKEDVSFALPA